jgi:hypothetical protein
MKNEPGHPILFPDKQRGALQYEQVSRFLLVFFFPLSQLMGFCVDSSMAPCLILNLKGVVNSILATRKLEYSEVRH